MTEKESAEYILKRGNCENLPCCECFLGHTYSFMRQNNRVVIKCSVYRATPFRARMIVANYLASLKEDEEENSV